MIPPSQTPFLVFCSSNSIIEIANNSRDIGSIVSLKMAFHWTADEPATREYVRASFAKAGDPPSRPQPAKAERPRRKSYSWSSSLTIQSNHILLACSPAFEDRRLDFCHNIVALKRGCGLEPYRAVEVSSLTSMGPRSFVW